MLGPPAAVARPERIRAMLAVWPWRKLAPPTGPSSPAQNIPAVGSGPPSAAMIATDRYVKIAQVV